MNMGLLTRTTLLVIALVVALLAGCSSSAPAEEYATVTVNGQVRMTAGPMPAGVLHFRLYNLESLEGELRHPLQEIDDFESDTANYSHTFEYPLHMGEGLAIHVWLDSDGDGIFCTPLARLDPSGLAYTETTPAGEVTLDITLSNNCRSADYFYPPAAVSFSKLKAATKRSARM